MSKPLHADSDLRKIGGLRTRADQLERRPATGGEGLQYNSGTYGPHNSGDWLDVTATGYDATLDAAIKILADVASGPIRIDASDQSMFLNAGSGSEGAAINLEAGTIRLTTDTVGGGIEIQGAVDIVMLTTSDSLSARAVGTSANPMFSLYDGSGVKLFEVWKDGTIHGRSAVGAITWDL